MMKKKGISIVMAACFMVTSLVFPRTTKSIVEAAQTTQNIGDVNGNKTVDLLDAQAVLKAALKIVKSYDKTVCDVNNDNKVDLTDAQLTLKAALKILPDFNVIRYTDDDYERIYGSVLNQYYRYLKQEYAIDELLELTDSSFFSANIMKCTVDDMGFTYYDVDGDMKKELLIGFTDLDHVSMNTGAKKGHFLTMYRIDKQNKVVRVKNQYRSYTGEICTSEIASGRDTGWFVCENGKMGLESYYGGGRDFYKYNGSDDLLDFIVGTMCDWAITGICHKKDSQGNVTVISEAEKKAIEDRYTPVDVQYTSFREASER